MGFFFFSIRLKKVSKHAHIFQQKRNMALPREQRKKSVRVIGLSWCTAESDWMYILQENIGMEKLTFRGWNRNRLFWISVLNLTQDVFQDTFVTSLSSTVLLYCKTVLFMLQEGKNTTCISQTKYQHWQPFTCMKKRTKYLENLVKNSLAFTFANKKRYITEIHRWLFFPRICSAFLLYELKKLQSMHTLGKTMKKNLDTGQHSYLPFQYTRSPFC